MERLRVGIQLEACKSELTRVQGLDYLQQGDNRFQEIEDTDGAIQLFYNAG